jgi:hypothetical protein
MLDPTASILHYPRKIEPIPAMLNCNITVTNYVGQAREDILTMAKHLGAKVSRNMSAENTHLICASAIGEKYSRALQWNMHIVNHFWLEDIYVSWTFQKEAKPKYSHFSIGLGDMVNKSAILGNKVAVGQVSNPNTTEPISQLTHRPLNVPNAHSGKVGFQEDNAMVVSTKENLQHLANTNPEQPKAIEIRKRSSEETVYQSISKKLKHSGHITVLFTGIRADPKYKKSLTDLGFRITDSTKAFDFLITNRVARTEKFLLAVAKGIPIVLDSWIIKCLESGTIIDYEDYLLQDSEIDLKSSLQRALTKPLLEGYRVFFTSNILPEPNILKRLIQASGGTPEQMVTSQNLESSIRKMKLGIKYLLVSSSKDSNLFPRLNQEQIPIYTGDFFLNCILKQEMNPSIKDIYN